MSDYTYMKVLGCRNVSNGRCIGEVTWCGEFSNAALANLSSETSVEYGPDSFDNNSSCYIQAENIASKQSPDFLIARNVI